MKKTSLIFIVCTFILLVLLSSLVSAFTLYVEKSSYIYVCPRESGVFTDVITSSKTTPERISITLEGTAAKWATIAPTDFFLNPAETKTIYSYVTPSSDAKAGDYTLDINIKSEEGTKTVRHFVTVKQCYKVTIATASPSVELCPAESAKYAYSITNNGEYPESFSLKLNAGELKDNFKISDSRLALNPAQSKTIYVYANAPKADGSYKFSLTAEADSGKSSSSIDSILVVKPCYDFNIEMDENQNYTVCEHSVLMVPIIIQNLGTTSNTYTTDVEGPSWAKSSRGTITMNANTSKTFHAVFAPDYGIEGAYQAEVKVAPDRGDRVSHSIINVQVKKCHDASITLAKQYYEICPGGATQTNTITFTNTGESEKQFAIEISSYPWLEVRGLNATQIISLAPKQSKPVNLIISPAKDAQPGRYKVSAKMKATDDSKIEKETIFDVNILPKDNCYLSNIIANKENMKLYYDASSMITITLTNKGILNEYYTADLSGAATSFAKLNPAILQLDPGKSAELYIYLAPTKDTKPGKYDLSLKVNTKQAESQDIKKFMIEITNNPADTGTQIIEEITAEPSAWTKFKSWLADLFTSDLNQTTNITIPANQTTEEQPTFWNKVKDNRYYIVSAIIIILVILIIIRLLLSPKKEEEIEEPKRKRKK